MILLPWLPIILDDRIAPEILSLLSLAKVVCEHSQTPQCHFLTRFPYFPLLTHLGLSSAAGLRLGMSLETCQHVDRVWQEPHTTSLTVPGLLEERCTGSMGSLGLPRMALLKVKPAVFYSTWLENKSAFCCFRVCSGKFPSFLGTLLQSCHVHTPHVPCPSPCLLCPLYAVGHSACWAATKPESIGGVLAELHKAL